MENLKIYFSHPSDTYGSIRQAKTAKEIQHFFRKSFLKKIRIVMPEDFCSKDLEDEVLMKHRFEAIEQCDILVVVDPIITYGMYREINYALQREKEVYFFKEGPMLKIEQYRKIDRLSEFEIIYWCTQTHRSYAKLKEKVEFWV